MENNNDVPLDGKYLSDDDIEMLEWLKNREKQGHKMSLSDIIILRQLMMKQYYGIVDDVKLKVNPQKANT